MCGKKRRNSMKKVLLAATLLVGFAASAQAASIVGTKHDLSNGIASANSVHSTDQNQTCVFCHAPHNAITNKLLWNRNAISGAGMKIYTSYNTSAMRTALTQNTLTDDSTSLLCLSCHSLGSVAAVFSNTQTTLKTPAAYGGTSFPSVTGNMTNLTNDHPVGINYVAAQGVAPTALNAASGGTVGSLRLFKSSVSGNTMECASCHDVHNNANGKFLAQSNANSALCVVCHNK
jgi:predicted CXXCH cytochrome family protein